MNQPTPRQIVKSILQGHTPERPLVVPILFSLGAKIENLSLRAYLENPTKISNALRQMRTHLRTDGVSCYFDPLLEAEAFGFSVHSDNASQARTISWPEDALKGTLPTGLRTPEAAATSERIKVAEEVIRRLKSLLRDEPLLMAGVSGPYTLAARLIQLAPGEIPRGETLSEFEAALELAAPGITRIASALVEAGANLIFIREDFFPRLSADLCLSWQSHLAPIFNIIRFYEALPVVQLPGGPSMAANAEVIAQLSWDAILCSSAPEFANQAASGAENFKFGMSLPAEALQAADSTRATFQVPAGAKPVLLTTDGDVPVATDLKRLQGAFETIARKI